MRDDRSESTARGLGVAPPHDPPRSRRNGFDAVRLLAALTVIAGHAVPLTGRGDPPTVGGMPFFDIAVYVFFALSGCLVSTSWQRTPQVRRFLRHRVARIFPALVLVVLVTVCVIGPITTSVALEEYFRDTETWAYLSNLVLLAAYHLPGVFDANPIGTVNGSLWTLGPEFTCYLIVFAVGLVVERLAPSRGIRCAVYAGIGTTMAAVPLLSGDEKSPLLAMVFFMVGAAVAALCRPTALPIWPALPLVVIWLTAGALSPVAGLISAWIAIPYAVLAIGSRPLPGLSAVGRPGDASYGMYLWGFPVQQITWSLAPAMPLGWNIAVVGAASYGLGVASWHLVEKRALTWARSRRDEN